MQDTDLAINVSLQPRKHLAALLRPESSPNAAIEEYQALFETKSAETIPFEDAKFSTSP